VQIEKKKIREMIKEEKLAAQTGKPIDNHHH
jgi:hypothetical protein